MKDFEQSNRELQRLYAVIKEKLDRISKLEAALAEIADSEFCNLKSNDNCEWDSGVGYGHRRCARIAAEALGRTPWERWQ